MTANEYFKKAFYIDFYTEPYIVMLFKERGLHKETYEAIKKEFRGKELYLTIAQTHISKVSLIVTEGDSFVLESVELDYDEDRFKTFVEKVDSEKIIDFFTDYAAVNEGLIFPLEFWAAEQQEDRLVFTGYNVI